MLRVSFRLEEKLVKKAEKLAKENDMTLSGYLRILVKEGINLEEYKKNKSASEIDKELRDKLDRSIIESLILNRFLFTKTSLFRDENISKECLEIANKKAMEIIPMEEK